MRTRGFRDLGVEQGVRASCAGPEVRRGVRASCAGPDDGRGTNGEEEACGEDDPATVITVSADELTTSNAKCDKKLPLELFCIETETISFYFLLGHNNKLINADIHKRGTNYEIKQRRGNNEAISQLSQ